MPWNTADQPFVYHPPVAPETPVADNTGAKLISAGSGAGIEMFTRMALANQQAQLAREKDLGDADLEAKKLELAKQQMSQDYELKKGYYDAMGKHWDEMAGVKKTSQDLGIAKMAAQNASTQNYFDTITENDTRAHQAQVDLKLLDEKFRTDHPVEWLANADEFKKRFGTAVVGDTPSMIKSLDVTSDQMKVPFLEGATYKVDPTDPTKTGWQAPSGINTKMVPLSQVADRFRDPHQQENTINSLVAAGAGTVAQSLKDIHGSKVPTTETTVTNPFVINALKEDTGNIKFGRGTPEVPTILQRTRPTAKMIQSNAANDPNMVAPDPVSDQSNQINNDAPLPQASASSTPVRALAYGPIVGEHTRATTEGPLGTLGPRDVAISPNLLRENGGPYQMGQMIDAHGAKGDYLGAYRIADTSYIKAGQPTHNAIEFRDRDISHQQVHISPAQQNDSSAGSASSATQDFQPTQTDIHLQHARNALQAGAPQDLIAQRLASLGIDPNLMMA